MRIHNNDYVLAPIKICCYDIFSRGLIIIWLESCASFEPTWKYYRSGIQTAKLISVKHQHSPIGNHKHKKPGA